MIGARVKAHRTFDPAGWMLAEVEGRFSFAAQYNVLLDDLVLEVDRDMWTAWRTATGKVPAGPALAPGASASRVHAWITGTVVGATINQIRPPFWRQGVLRYNLNEGRFEVMFFKWGASSGKWEALEPGKLGGRAWLAFRGPTAYLGI